jgi:hypothetical protein
MADIAFDSVTYDLVVTASSETFSHTNNGNTVLVGLYHFVAGNNGDLVSGITYAGAAMTRLGTVTVNANERCYLYIKTDAAAGANNVVVSYTTNVIAETHAISVSSAGSSQPDASSTNSGTSSTWTGNVTTIADKAYMIMFARGQANASSMGSGTTNRSITGNGGGVHNPNNGFCDSGAVITPAGSNTLTVNASSSDAWATISCSLSPQSTTVIRQLALTGVGQ